MVQYDSTPHHEIARVRFPNGNFLEIKDKSEAFMAEDQKIFVDVEGGYMWSDPGPLSLLSWHLDELYKWAQFDYLEYTDGSVGWVIPEEGNFRYHDLARPALVKGDGTLYFYEYGLRSREESKGPAVIRPDGSLEFWRNGMEHRENGPAIIKSDGTQLWYREGRNYNDSGPSAIHPNGEKKFRRSDTPPTKEELESHERFKTLLKEHYESFSQDLIGRSPHIKKAVKSTNIKGTLGETR